MKYIRKFMVPIMLFAITILCLAVVMLSGIGEPIYAPTAQAAIKLHKFYVCSGEVQYDPGLGYLCDGYGPNAFIVTALVTGFTTFWVGVLSLLWQLRAKPVRKRKV